MTDLVQRLKARIALLREINETPFADELEQATARIEALEAELALWREAGKPFVWAEDNIDYRELDYQGTAKLEALGLCNGDFRRIAALAKEK